MFLGYNTNGLAHHDLIDAIELLASIGYRSVAITLDHGALHPWDSRLEDQLRRVAEVLAKHGMQSVVETGARYLLDPRTKHEPTLVSRGAAGRSRRVEFLTNAIDIATELNALCVSLWSGVLHDDVHDNEAWQRLLSELATVMEYADSKNVGLGFEPEPGMFVATMSQYAELLDRLKAAGANADKLQLTLDVGHLHCLRELPINRQIHAWCDRLANIHIEDMRHGVHEHLMFGEGEIDFPPVIAALADVGYRGPLHVELSRHSHEGPIAAQRAFDFLQPLITQYSAEELPRNPES